jgi:nucleoside-diphosphate-sugar epimerase
MRIVVTGASGNVGTSVLDALARDDAVSEIAGVARRLPSRSFAKTTWASADIRVHDLASIFAGADVVIHLAWLIQPSRDERQTRSVNVDGSARVFDAVARAGVPALVYASSVGAYAPGPVDRAVDESWPTTGVQSCFYARHKADVERLLDDFESANPGVRCVRLRPGLIFKSGAASEIRRLFIGPFLPSRLMRRELIGALPYPRGLRTQAVHGDDVGEAYRLAATRPVAGAFNIAADPVLDAQTIARALHARILPLAPAVVRAAASASWRLRLQPTSPGWLDMGMQTPIMDIARARGELGWQAQFSSQQAVLELLRGLHERDGLATPPLQPSAGGRFRWRELASGVGGEDAAG